MQNFNNNRKYIENEFEMAVFDKNTGLSAEDLAKHLQEIQNTQTEESRRLVCANAYAFLLDNVQLQINEHTPFAVKFNLGIDYSYFASTDIFQKALFIPQRDKILSQKFPKEYTHMKNGLAAGLGDIYTDFWHTVPNWENILQKGFCGILKDAKESKKATLNSGKYSEEQILFLDSVIICYEAILRLLERIYVYSLSFDVAEFSHCIKNLISNPPATLYEAMQTSILYLYFEEIGCERGRTLGKLDEIYYPFFKKEVKNGNFENAKELFKFFFIHFTATKRFAQQPFAIGGGSANGEDFSNDLTEFLLDVYDELDIYDPKIHVRYHKNINQAILKKAISMIRKGHSSICIINDGAVFDGYERIGIPKKEAENYVLLGCYEPIIAGKEEAEIGTTWLNMAKCIEFAVNGGKDLRTGTQIGFESPSNFECFEDFFKTFLDQLDYCLDFAIDFAQKQGLYSTLVNPSPIYSSSFDECIKKGMDVHEYPLKYNNMSLKTFALATVVDSLVSVKKYVFEKKTLSFAELKNALICNWEGYEDLRNEILNDPEKYGNNLPLPDEITVRITKHLEEKYCGIKLTRGGALRLGLDSIDLCKFRADATNATPDGRLASTPVSRNLCAYDGMDKSGITSYMLSVLKINSAAFLNSAIFDFMLHPSSVEGEKGLCDFCSLVKIFFENGGFALQGNVINAETLKKAQINPEKYSTLQVRVCGWNEYFVKLSPQIQNMFIKKCEVNNS